MGMLTNRVGPVALAFGLGLGMVAYTTRSNDRDEAAPAPPDTAAVSSGISRDTPPAGAAKPAPATAGQPGPKVSKLEYEGWRQYSANCARCHGQDVLPNPVAANLLISLGPGGPINTPEKFAKTVTAGRPSKGMPAFKDAVTPHHIKAIYAYVKGRAEKRIAPGRPAKPSG